MMDISNQLLHQEITDKLKTAPKEVLEVVLSYLNGISNKNISQFELSEEQKESLLNIRNRSYSEHTDVDIFINEMSEKYGI
ncbi:hypothetical protein [Epilithonimonas sp. UC225_85]|uniref:hypothetical protein n=1 Tax=Epilithonimonas sp. UC225_85 TaxID=3350167 RepID=UPI0036D2C579